MITEIDENLGGHNQRMFLFYLWVQERKADVLDMILAMILQRQPPRSHRESESEHFTELAELHSEVCYIALNRCTLLYLMNVRNFLIVCTYVLGPRQVDKRARRCSRFFVARSFFL